jgi:hypothetical protein
MASTVQICNMALSHLGSEARVSSISPPDGSVEAGHCATFYDLARTEMIEPGNWNFTLRREALAQATNPSTVWAFAYALPSDCLRALRILKKGSALTVFNQDAYTYIPNDRDTAVFDIEGDLLFTNEEDAVLVYARDVIDTTKYTATFTAALSYLLAAYLAGPIVKGNEGAKLGDAMRDRAFSMASLSATAAANSSGAENEMMSSILSVRA